MEDLLDVHQYNKGGAIDSVKIVTSNYKFCCLGMYLQSDMD